MKRQPPASIDEALKRPAVNLVDIAAITGLSYGTVVNDVRNGHLRALSRRFKRRRSYRVTRDNLAAYLRSLGYTIGSRPRPSA